MIIVTGLNFMIGHLPYFTWTFIITLIKKMNQCYSIFPLISYYISYADSIFFYFFFNNIFKKFLIESIPLINRNTS
jgi:hypothetical protein